MTFADPTAQPIGRLNSVSSDWSSKGEPSWRPPVIAEPRSYNPILYLGPVTLSYTWV